MIHLQYKLEETLEGQNEALSCAMSPAGDILPEEVQAMRPRSMYSSRMGAAWAGKGLNTCSSCCVTALGFFSREAGNGDKQVMDSPPQNFHCKFTLKTRQQKCPMKRRVHQYHWSSFSTIALTCFPEVSSCD